MLTSTLSVLVMTDAGAAGPALPGAPTTGTPLPSNPLVTTWPAQAVNPAAACTPAALRPGTAQLLSSRVHVVGDQPLAVDPWAPCHVYLRNTLPNENELLRSDDSGRSYSPVLQAGGASVVLGPVAIPAPGVVSVFDDEGAHVIDRSSDSGAHWQQRGTDLPVVVTSGACSVCLEALAYAPSDAAIAYAALGQSGVETIYRSSDGGSSWAAAGSVGSMYAENATNKPFPITVDPRDANHLYVVAGLKAVADTLLESRDGGTSWQPVKNLPRQDAPSAVVVSATGALYVAYGAADETPPPWAGPSQLLMSADDGANWSTVKVPIAAASAWSFGLDPNDGSRGMFAGVAEDPARGWLLVLADTHDGFRTIDSARTVVLRKPAPTAPCPSNDECAINVLPDRLGDFYVDVVAGDAGGANERVTELLVGVHAPLATLADGAVAAPPAATSSGGGTSAVQPPPSAPPGTTVAGQLARSCQLPAYASQTNAAGSPMSSGSLAYDGQSLLYSDPGDDSSQPDTALIRKFDPSTCAPTGVILVQFNPSELQQYQDPSYPPVEIGEMTYDARRQVLWVELRDAYHSGANPGAWASGRPALFTVKVTDPAPQPVEHAIARLALATGCSTSIDEWLTYDFTSDTLLTCDVNAPLIAPAAGGEFVVHKLSAVDGHVVPSCLDSFRPQTSDSNPLVGWTVTRPGEVYAESEDDKTMVSIEVPEDPAQACDFGTVYEHAADAEPGGEDEELACDSQTFSTGGTTRTVAWIRNTGHVAFSYDVPGGRCPLPTFTNYLSPQTVALRGMTSFCASTVVHFLEGYKVLPAGLPVTFSAGSQRIGVGYTSGGPDVCTPLMANPLPLGASVVTASFPGTDAYLPSSGSGTVVSTAGVAAAQVPPVAAALGSGPLTPPGTPVQSGPVSQAQIGEQAQAQAQSQSQAQAQSQAQTQSVTQAQPGVMVQRQRQRQVAVQEQGAATNTAYQASALRRGQQSPAAVLVAELLLLVCALSPLRPRWAVNRRHRHRR